MTARVTNQHFRMDLLAARASARRQLADPERNRRIRLDAGVTLEEMGHAVGVSGEAIRLWEEGKRFPAEAHVDSYLLALKVLQGEGRCRCCGGKLDG